MPDMIHYETDPMHTFVTFAVKHFATSTVRGRFDEVSGSIDLDAHTHAGHAEITIDMASIDSGIAQFNEHLKSDAFFDAARHPTARFTGNDFRWQGNTLVAVAGELTLRDQTHPLTLKCLAFNRYDSPLLHAPVAGGDFEATLERSRWGVDWGLELGIPDAVKLLIQIEAVQQQP